MSKNIKLKDILNIILKEQQQNGTNIFNGEQKLNAQNLFKEVFDYYLKKISPQTYPMIYHCTSIDKYESIKKYGLTSERNYFLEGDNNMMVYGFNGEGDEEPGIACGVNYKSVIERLYPDPEWLMDILDQTGNPSKFKQNNVDDKIIYCLWVKEVLKLDLNQKLTLKDVDENQLRNIVDKNMFYWLYVKGKVDPKLINIKIHPDLNP